MIACVVSIATSPVPADTDRATAEDRYTRRSRRIAPGLRLINIVDSIGPNRIRVLKVDPSSPLTLDVELAQDKLPGRETTSSMARRRGALAATNGTFGLPWGRPIGLFAEDTHLQASPLTWGRALGITSDESSFPIGHPELDVGVSHPITGHLFKIPNWNVEGPDPTRVAAYTPAGAPRLSPPPDSCAARLVRAGPPRWSLERPGLTRTYEVEQVRCAAEALDSGEGIVLAAQRKTRGARRVRSLQAGDVVDLTWSVGWSGVVDAIAGNPRVVTDGENVGYECDVYFCRRTPRTAVAINERGRILLVTVDGAQPGYSVGMTLVELGDLLVYLNAEHALNLDGGGSTTMVVDGRVINRPTEASGERAVSSAILVLPGRDEEEPTMGPAPPPRLAPLPDGVRGAGPSDTSVVDAGSTGGLLHALKRGALGRRIDLPPGLDRIARIFATAARD